MLAETIYPSEEQAKVEETTKLVAQQTKPGTYPVSIKFKQNNQVIEKEIRCTVIGENTKEKGQYAINADATQITPNQVGHLTLKEWLALTNAYAWNIRTGDSAPILRVHEQEIQAQPGNYALTIEAIDGLVTEVNVEVLDTTKIKMQHFYQKNIGDWSETYADKGAITWSHFETQAVVLIQITLLLLLFLPLLCLVIQYLMTSKLVKQVVHLVMKP